MTLWRTVLVVDGPRVGRRNNDGKIGHWKLPKCHFACAHILNE